MCGVHAHMWRTEVVWEPPQPRSPTLHLKASQAWSSLFEPHQLVSEFQGSAYLCLLSPQHWVYRCVLPHADFTWCWGSKQSSSCLGRRCCIPLPSPQAPGCLFCKILTACCLALHVDIQPCFLPQNCQDTFPCVPWSSPMWSQAWYSVRIIRKFTNL